MYRSPLLLGLALTLTTSVAVAGDFKSDWDNQHDRVWIGPQFWANPLEDWRLDGGRLECTTPAPGRSVHLLTHQLGDQDGTFEMSVVVGLPMDVDDLRFESEAVWNQIAGSRGSAMILPILPFAKSS